MIVCIIGLDIMGEASDHYWKELYNLLVSVFIMNLYEIQNRIVVNNNNIDVYVIVNMTFLIISLSKKSNKIIFYHNRYFNDQCGQNVTKKWSRILLCVEV